VSVTFAALYLLNWTDYTYNYFVKPSLTSLKTTGPGGNSKQCWVQWFFSLIHSARTVWTLEALLGLKERAVRLTLLSLHSMAIVPDAGDDSIRLRLIHPSSHDFLVDPERCDDDNFAVNARIRIRCLPSTAYKSRKCSPDMCKIEDASLYKQEVVDLPSRFKSHIPAHVQYACRHWASHPASGGISDNGPSSSSDNLDRVRQSPRMLLLWVCTCD
jgi:hypothetical protein